MTIAERFWMKAVRDPETDCWEWVGARVRGYGRMFVRGTTYDYAHRIGYSLTIGPIPDGLTIDHLCRNRGCVNPSHLEAVTMYENQMRGNSPTAVNARRTVCQRGHDFTPENTHVRKNGTRECRICKRAAWRAWKERAA